MSYAHEDCLCGASVEYVAHGEISASFTHVFNDDAAWKNAVQSRQLFTLTVRRRVRWWKRPWYWLRRKPTTSWESFSDVVFDSVHVGDEGVTAVRAAG